METYLVFFPSSLGYPLVWEIWRLIARELFLSPSIWRSIGRLWAQSGDLEFSHDLDRDIVRANWSLIRIP